MQNVSLVAQGIFIEYPTSVSSYTNVVIFNGWSGSRIKLLTKYALPYRERGCIIFYLETPWQISWSVDEQDRQNLLQFDPVIQKIKELNIDIFSKSSISHAILHTFSDGGAYQLWRMSLLLRKKSIYLNIRGLIFDCSPGNYDLDCLNSYVQGMVVDGAKPGSLQYAVKKSLAIVIASLMTSVYSLSRTVGLRDMYHVNNGVLFTEEFRRLPRLFLYSRNDKLINYKQLENHINAIKSIGAHVETEIWESAEHVKLLPTDPNRYYSKVSQFLDRLTSDKSLIRIKSNFETNKSLLMLYHVSCA
ncbi:hypothetical protein HK098_006801 [Nowakowskiella sp. JEL0407]|nr:hypothetical protein HK098_006801 [Nowakowskiella sp. JEL0407]